MAKKSLKELLLNRTEGDYYILRDYVLTEQDVKDFYDLYRDYTEIESKYQTLVFGRKEQAKVLSDMLTLLSEMGEIIFREINAKKNEINQSLTELEYANIEDEMKALEIIKELANAEEAEYDIKVIHYQTYDSSERHGYRTMEEYTGEVVILAKKQALDKLEDDSIISKEIAQIYEEGHSFIVFGNDEFMTSRLSVPKQILENYQPLVFCSQGDDVLANAFSLFVHYVNQNGAKFPDISVLDIAKEIKKTYLKRVRVLTNNNEVITETSFE